MPMCTAKPTVSRWASASGGCKAITYGIDRQTMVDTLLEGRATIIDAPLLPTSWAYPEKGVLNHYDYNMDHAIELLKKAG